MLEFGRCARGAARTLAQLASAQKSAVLHAMADEIDARQSAILAANDQDLIAAKANALSDAMIDRLTLNRERLQAIAASIRDVSGLPDPIGQVIREWTQPNGLHISKVRVPIGVIGIIYESRPNVTSDSAVLCIKTGNAAILRGGSESIRSNLAIAEALQCGGAKAGLPADSVLLVPNTDRDAIRHMAQMDRYIDLIIPRGGSALIEMVVTHARMPVIKHSHGLCIAYVDRAADLDMAANIVVNAKTQRPGVCNAIETTLIHRDVARAFLEKVAPLLKAKKVELRADEAAFAQLSALNYQPLLPATPSDWSTEFLDLVMALAVVENIDAAIAHIDQYGSHHSDSIVTRDEATAEKFLREIDSATVYWNASTRFTDGGQFGFGAEIGISTDKLHARGPMALEELTTYKYIIRGTGQVRT
ncbi:MAG TPA: glutamate-5-semialdehyde dehydrogenase [Chthoniobacterales bacterium]